MNAAPSLFAYYVAHAPATPHAWFKPVVSAQPEKPEPMPANPRGLIGKSIAGWFTCLDDPTLTAEERQWATAYNEYTKARALWEEHYKVEASRQWPVAFAKEMLAQHPETQP